MYNNNVQERVSDVTSSSGSHMQAEGADRVSAPLSSQRHADRAGKSLSHTHTHSHVGVVGSSVSISAGEGSRCWGLRKNTLV